MNKAHIETFGYQYLFNEKKKHTSYTGWLTFFDLILKTTDLDLPGFSNAEATETYFSIKVP